AELAAAAQVVHAQAIDGHGEIRVDDPCTVRLYWPRTNGVTVVPGISSARAGVLRIGVGIESSTSRLATMVDWLLITSTAGVSPVTVSVSSTAPTDSSALTCAVKVPSRTMSVRLTVLKPASVKDT